MAGVSPNRLLRIPRDEYDQVAPHLEHVLMNPKDFGAGGGKPMSQVPGAAARVSAGVFIELLEQSPHLRRRLQHYALCLFHETVRTAACNRLHTVEQRLEEYALTHDALARTLGVRRPYLTRTARDLQLDGLVQYRHAPHP